MLSPTFDRGGSSNRPLPAPSDLNLIRDLPQSFVKEASGLLNFLIRRRFILFGLIAPGVGGWKVLREMILCHAYADHSHTNDKVARCIGRSLGRIIDTEDLGGSMVERKANKKGKRRRGKRDREQRTRSNDDLAESDGEEADIHHFSIDDPEIEFDVAATTKNVDRELSVLQCLAQMGPVDQELIWLACIEEKTVREMEDELDIPRSTIDRRLQVAKARLAVILTESGFG